MQANYEKPQTLRKSMGSVTWLFQAISGAFLVFFVGVHLYVAHINFGNPVAFFRDVLINMHNPWWLLFYIVFTWLIVYHALNGVRGVVFDLNVKPGTRRLVNYVLIAVYFVLVIYGTILAFIIAGSPIPTS